MEFVGTRLSLGNLNYEVDETELAAFVEEQLGVAAVDVSIPTSTDTGRRRGFAFVGVVGIDLATAIEKLHDVPLRGRKVSCAAATEKPRRVWKGRQQ